MGAGIGINPQVTRRGPGAICIHGSDERSDTIDIDKEASSEQATTADGNLQYAGGEPAIDGASGH
uniref:Uncharacterized protein n=1 Tax=Oryza sativa subsp. japonica TaxID=39947 RepID=Q94LD7_ORYSJ|nr:hypothetical protein [Oryza sativa Japonica Group]